MKEYKCQACKKNISFGEYYRVVFTRQKGHGAINKALTQLFCMDCLKVKK